MSGLTSELQLTFLAVITLHLHFVGGEIAVFVIVYRIVPVSLLTAKLMRAP